MKEKIARISLMLGILVMLASCTQDDGLGSPIEGDDGLVPVALSVNIADGMTTRAINKYGDHEAQRCYVQITDGNGDAFPTGHPFAQAMLMKRSTSTLFTKDDVYIYPNEAYTFLFWADDETHSDDNALTDLTAVKYVENSVAYAGKETKEKTTNNGSGPIAVNAKLKHVVTKVTLKTTTDLKDNTKITVDVPTTYSTYNVFGETFTNQTASSYQHTITLTNDLTADATNGTAVGSFYALVGNANQIIRITNANNLGVYEDVTEVPIGPDKHITLLGDVANAGLTGVTFTASVDEDWSSNIPDLPFETQDLTQGAINITQDGTYHITSNGTTTTNAITISGTISPTVYISDLNINVNSGNAISITGGANATIFVIGENELQVNKRSNGGAGIYVAKGSTVTITGSSRNDILTARAGGDASGIGGYLNNSSQGEPCGKINISNVTVYAYASSGITYSPGIGTPGGVDCDGITISKATVHAYGTGGSSLSCPAIGQGLEPTNLRIDKIPTISISDDSEIHAHRGAYNNKCWADYIGAPGASLSHYYQGTNLIQLGTGGTITNSVIYCYTGNSNNVDYTFVYDANGNRTEQ